MSARDSQFTPVQRIKQLLAPLRHSPLHPQWLLRGALTGNDLSDMKGKVLDIGCAGGAVARLLPEGAQYIGLDYYQTATTWYRTHPQVFGDGQQLPIADESIDGILMLHVLEHIPSPGIALAEAFRVLKPGGSMLVETPFIYPVHDAPLDFHRWTLHGLRHDLQLTGLQLHKLTPIGRPLETAAVMLCLGLGKLNLEWWQRRSPALLLAPLTWIAIPLINLSAWLLARLGDETDFMPHRVRVLVRKDTTS